MNIIEEEFRLMDALPRREAYVSMFVLGLGLGVLLMIFVNIAAALLLF